MQHHEALILTSPLAPAPGSPAGVERREVRVTFVRHPTAHGEEGWHLLVQAAPRVPADETQPPSP